MISAISVRVIPFFRAVCRWYVSELSVIPWLMSEVMVTRLRSRSPRRSVRLQTSPKSTSSLSSANLGANSPSWSRPAVCFVFSCAIIVIPLLNTHSATSAKITLFFIPYLFLWFRFFSGTKLAGVYLNFCIRFTDVSTRNVDFWRLALLDVQCYICNRKRVRSFSDKILYTDYG